TTIPGKFQSYCSVGKPLLVGVGGELSIIVTNSKCGWVFQPENKDEMVERLIEIAKTPKERLIAMGEIAKDLYETNFSYQVGIEKFNYAITDLLAKAKR
ncbi:MAG: hypothetical protein ACKO13_10415, partial [Cytophagales bacterium]